MNLEKAPNSGDLGTAPIIDGSSPQHQVTIESSFNLSKAVTLDLTYRYVSSLPGLVVPSYRRGTRGSMAREPACTICRPWDGSFQPSHSESSGDPDRWVGIAERLTGRITWTLD